MTLNRDGKKISHVVTPGISHRLLLFIFAAVLAAAPAAWGQAGSATGTVRWIRAEHHKLDKF